MGFWLLHQIMLGRSVLHHLCPVVHTEYWNILQDFIPPSIPWASEVKQLQSQYALFNPWWLAMQLTHGSWHCVPVCETQCGNWWQCGQSVTSFSITSFCGLTTSCSSVPLIHVKTTLELNVHEMKALFCCCKFGTNWIIGDFDAKTHKVHEKFIVSWNSCPFSEQKSFKQETY
jgi:hypothetical protein